jgi:hypothetical protein
MINEHEAAKYVENNTTLAKDVYVAARRQTRPRWKSSYK